MMQILTYVLCIQKKHDYKLLKYIIQLHHFCFQFTLIFCSAEIELKEKILTYDYTSLFADIGGYSGLLLGLSFFNLADMMCDFIEKYIM